MSSVFFMMTSLCHSSVLIDSTEKPGKKFLYYDFNVDALENYYNNINRGSVITISLT